MTHRNLEREIANLIDERVLVDLAGVRNANRVAADIMKLVKRRIKTIAP